MPYNLIDENETHFVLHDGNESFPVAKFGLDDTTMGRIRSLPMGYADGGMVEPIENQPLPIDVGSVSKFMSGPVYRGAEIAPLEGVNFATPEQLNAMSFPKADAIETGMFGQEIAPVAPLAVPAPTPAAQPEVPAYMNYMNQFTAGKGQQQQQGYDLPGEYAQGYQTMLDASRQQADASAQAALEQQKIYEQQVKDIQLNEIARQKQEQAVQGELDKLKTDIATQKIDPTRVWSNMSTGNRVMAAISIFLGGVAGGMQGTDNKALGIINNAIDKDIDAQKAELGKKQNLLSINLQKYRNIQDAAAATKAQLMAVTQAQVAATAAKAGSQQALTAAKMFQGQTELEMGKLKMQLAASQMTQAKLQDPRGISPQDAMKMNQEIQSTLVQLPNGNYYPAWNKESATEIKKKQTALYPIKSLVKEASEFMDKGGTLPLSRRNAEANRLEKSLMIELKNLNELGQLTQGDMEIIEPLLPSLGDFFQSKSRDALAGINRQIDNKLNAVYSANIPGLNPMGRQSREQSVFGGR